MWNYYNPSKIVFKTGILDDLKLLDLIPKKNIVFLPIQTKFLKI